MHTLTLNQLQVGEKGKIVRIIPDCRIRRRLMDMGVIPGTRVTVEKLAPLGDPMDIRIRGYHLSLRKEEAATIAVERI